MPAYTALAGTPTPILFFTGKGGVGKTSLACATAIHLADAGRRVLLVSTDPASNLDEVLDVRLSGDPTAIPGVPGLSALNIDPAAAAQAYRDRVIGPYRQLLPAPTVARMEEQLSGACTTEIAAFDEFTRLLGSDAIWADWDHVVFDTAPTGHTLRLLNLPAAWDSFIDTNATGTSCLGPLSGLKAQHATYKASLAALRDSEKTTVVLVSRPDGAALTEADRTRAELAQIGITHQQLVVNAIFQTADPHDAIAVALEDRGRQALAALPDGLRTLPRRDVPLLAIAPMGVERLRGTFAPPSTSPSRVQAPVLADVGAPLSGLVRELASSGRGVVLTMGKGGVGKTTVAAAIALELARLGHRVHLSMTDPAAHLEATLAGGGGSVTVSRINPVVETRRYTEEVLAAATTLDAQGRALLEEDLRSPCTEEIAVFRAFARTVARGAEGFVVLDTAPTGHTILLLDAAEAYHREVARTQSDVPDEVRQLLPRLRDPGLTHVLLVTLPEATPVHEAAQLQADLRRAGIQPWAWIVNQSFAATTTTDPVLRERSTREGAFIDEVRVDLAPRVCVLPWQPEPPVGPRALLALAGIGAAVGAP